MDLVDYYLLFGGILLPLVLLLLYTLFRQTQERVREESKLSALLSRSRSMKSFLERFDEIDAELSILRTQIAKIESELKAIEKRRARTND